MKRTASALTLILALLISLVPVVNAPSSSSSTPSVPPAMEWDTFYGAKSGLTVNQRARVQLIQTSDGGYAIAGNVVVHSYLWGALPPYVWLVKADATGKMEWEQSYDYLYGAAWNQSYDHLYNAAGLVQTSDGGYVIAGNSYTKGTGTNIRSEGIKLLKTDLNGSVQWSRTYKVPDVEYYDGATSMVQTNDGGYAIAGNTGNISFLIKTDSYGKFQLKRTYGEPDKDNSFSSVIQTGDGGYALAGTTKFNGSDASWLVKTDRDGNIMWNQTYPSKLGTNDTTFDNYATSVIQTDDGGYALAANQRIYWARNEYSEVWLVKTDSLGDMVWNQTFNDYVYVYSIIQTSDGGLAFAGNAQRYWSWQAWIVKLDASGNAEWNQTYPNRSGGGDGWTAYRLIETSDGGFALAGSWKHTSSVNYYFLVKTEPALPPPTPTPTPSSPPSTGFLSGENLALFASLAVAAVLIALVAVAVFRRRKKQTLPASST